MMLSQMNTQEPAVVMFPARIFMAAAGIVACVVLGIGQLTPLPVSLLAAEVFLTILGLFVFGSFRYQIHKNALTYGMALIIAATFCGIETSEWHRQIAVGGWWSWAQQHVLSFHGLDELIHADTMLFILGLTFFVAVIAQTRVLEGVTFFLLRRNGGAILPTVIAVTAVVAFSSGILDGVSMIGLTIRTLVIILMLAAAPKAAILQAVMICTTVTTVCGVWLAYGEPPNLIMKANLEPHLAGAFFIRYCGPVALVGYLVVARHLRKKLKGQRINLETMDVLDANAEDVRFLQASRHGEVLTPVELVEAHQVHLGGKAPDIVQRLQRGTSLGRALVDTGVPWETREVLLGHYVTEELAPSLDRHYTLDAQGDDEGAMLAEQWVDDTLAASAQERRRAQRFGGLALVPFVGLLVLHGVRHDVPLFLASFAGFATALVGIFHIPKMRALALREARHEYAEYYFLFPLFLSITLLTQAGFFSRMEALIHEGVGAFGLAPVAWGQFAGATMLSAILDNNIVADFASRALGNLDLHVLHLFAMAQVAGYALGGCWTHIGSAQSVVAYSFIQRDVDAGFTPVQWITQMTPIILEMFALITVVIFIESRLLNLLQ
jgi:Na+/H+ antiporter NhaD/arsenite permease-like protein